MSEKGPFRKGYDSRRINQNKDLLNFHNEVSELARKQAPAMLDIIYKIANDPKSTKQLQFTAAKELLDRGLGKPVDTVVSIDMQSRAAVTDVKKLSDEQLAGIVSASLPPDSMATDESHIIDGEVIECTEVVQKVTRKDRAKPIVKKRKSKQ